MRVYMRNKGSGEIRDVEADSEEFFGLQKQVTTVGLPMWEQTSYAHANAVKGRAAEDALLEEDLGTDAQDELRYEALRLNDDGIAPEANPHLALSPGEIEQGLTPEDKLHDLEQQYEDSVRRRRGILRSSAESIADGDVQNRGTTQSRGQSARAGGSDERDGAPPTGVAPDESGSGEGQPPPPRTPATAGAGSTSGGGE